MSLHKKVPTGPKMSVTGDLATVIGMLQETSAKRKAITRLLLRNRIYGYKRGEIYSGRDDLDPRPC